MNITYNWISNIKPGYNPSIFSVVSSDAVRIVLGPSFMFIWYWSILPFGLVGAFQDISKETSNGLSGQLTSVGGPGSV